MWGKSRRLNLDTFESTVIKDDHNVWVVSFINPHCDACKRFVPHWDQVQLYESMRNRNIKFAFVNVNG